MLDKAFTPLADGVAVAPHLGDDVLVGKVVVLGSTQDDATAEGQSLGSGSRAGEGFESFAKSLTQFDGRGKGAWHGGPPDEQDPTTGLDDSMATHLRFAY